MKHLVTALGLVLALATSTQAAAAEPTVKTEAPRLVPFKGQRPEARSQGKPAVPVRVTTSLQGTVIPEKDLPVMITVTPSGAVKRSGAVRVRLRGLDGVLLVKGEPLSVPFKALAPLRVMGTVRVPKGVAGSLVVDVLLELDGKHQATSQAFELVATGATPVPQVPGRLVQGSDGQEVIVLEPSAKN
jgi:hypothetical protein